MFEIFKLNKKKAVIKENIALLEANKIFGKEAARRVRDFQTE
nr:MAG TPA: hypothetical protein [Caudoviricetes sp.]